MTAVVIPVRPGDDNPELVYALRSIAAHVADPDVWIVGHRPRWLTDVHWIPTHPRGRKPDRGCQQTRAAVTHPDTPESFWWWDDDMFALAPVPGFQVWHGGRITDWLTTYRHTGSHYADVVARTCATLPPESLFYDLHVPIPCDKHAVAETLTHLPDGHGGWLWRTVYGNRHRLGGQQIDDVKLYGDDPVPDSGPWLSCDDAAFPRLRQLLDDLLPHRSPWERPRPPRSIVYRRGSHRRRIRYRPRKDAYLLARGWQREVVA